MPATEQILRNPKVMHAVFGVSSMVMLFATVWMFADDHAAEYKNWQSKAIDIEQWTADARVGEKLTAEYQLDVIAKNASLAKARSSAIEAELLTAFRDSIEQDAERRAEEGEDVEAADFSALDSAVGELNDLADAINAITCPP